MIDVSIVIPAYNVEKYITKGIETAINQTHGNIEIIIVDDGSTDNTLRVIEKYAQLDNRIVTIRKKNGGVSSARNEALECARGRYVIFLDSDDWLELDAVEILLSRVEENLLLCCSAFFVDMKGTRVSQCLNGDVVTVEKEAAQAAICTSEFRLSSSCYKLFDKKIIDKFHLKFDEALQNGEDGLFSFQYLCHVEGIKYIPKALWNILERPGSATTSRYTPKMNSALKAIELMMNENISENIKRRLEMLYSCRALGLLIDSIKDGYRDKNDYEFLLGEVKRYFDVWMEDNFSIKRKLQLFILDCFPYFFVRIIFRR